MAFAPAAVDASSALPSGQALKYKSCRRYPLHTIRADPVKIEHARYGSKRATDDHRRDNAKARDCAVSAQWRVSPAGAGG
jgi:hypothetical protein